MANARFLLRQSEDEMDKVDKEDMELMRSCAENRISFAKRLGDRLSNMGVCLKSSGRLEEALAALDEASEVLSSADDMQGLVRVMGNRALCFKDYKNYAEADKIFQNAYEVSYNAFRAAPNESTVQAFQLSCSMVARNIKENVDENIITDPAERRHAITNALKHFYYALTVSNRIKADTLKRCVLQISQIYTSYFTPDQCSEAVEQLREMFPKSLPPPKPSVSVLLDVSPSMNNNKRIFSATETLTNIVTTKMQIGDVFSLDCFATKHDKVFTRQKITRENWSIITDAIYSCNYRCTTGVTHFYRALLELGESIVAVKKNPRESNLVFALTDGEDNEYKTRTQDVKEYFVENNIVLMIITIGVSDRAKRNLLELVTDEKFIVAARGDDKSSIDEAMKTGYDFVVSHGAVVMETL